MSGSICGSFLVWMCIGLDKTLLALHGCQSWHLRVIMHVLSGFDLQSEKNFDTCLCEKAIHGNYLNNSFWTSSKRLSLYIHNTLVCTHPNLWVCNSQMNCDFVVSLPLCLCMHLHHLLGVSVGWSVGGLFARSVTLLAWKPSLCCSAFRSTCDFMFTLHLAHCHTLQT